MARNVGNCFGTRGQASPFEMVEGQKWASLICLIERKLWLYGSQSIWFYDTLWAMTFWQFLHNPLSHINGNRLGTPISCYEFFGRGIDCIGKRSFVQWQIKCRIEDLILTSP